MTSLAARAEVVKLARELQVDATELAFLLDSDPVAVRRVRQGMYRALDAPYRPMFERLAKVSALIPIGVSVAIATRFFGPMLCGMVASSLSPERAAAMIGHVPVPFLADVAPYVDPEAATPIVRQFGTDVLLPVLREMLRRKDYVTLSRFVVAASDAQLRAVLPAIESGEDMLMVAFGAELDAVADRFDLVLAELPDDRVREILAVAADQNLFTEALTFLSLLSERTLTRVAELAAGMDPIVLTNMVTAAQREDAWTELVAVAAAMSPESLQRLLDLEIWDTEDLRVLAETAERDGRFEELRRRIEAVSDQPG
ncbi:hypothetical protein D7D52_34430 [Nocardia yunnanensis]|uniref:Uncharacterized protein n=1 Tax=Nocardia yunnanensis TaxID=2382165 RepID=A0A386ZN09_9NOCA|nr:hypothetical protein [Nocardia yunnanensis]AYF78079.1 hypothetical protein D7D52_34430 [Nocardia yunnanensis]